MGTRGGKTDLDRLIAYLNTKLNTPAAKNTIGTGINGSIEVKRSEVPGANPALELHITGDGYADYKGIVSINHALDELEGYVHAAMPNTPAMGCMEAGRAEAIGDGESAIVPLEVKSVAIALKLAKAKDSVIFTESQTRIREI